MEDDYEYSMTNGSEATLWAVRNKKIIDKSIGKWEVEYLNAWIDEKEDELVALEIRYLHNKHKLEDELAVLKQIEKGG